MVDNKKKSPPEFNLLVLQISAVAIIVVAAVVIKFFGGAFYTDVRNWYIDNFEDETKISEVIPEEDDGENKPTEREPQIEELPPSESDEVIETTQTVEVLRADAAADCNTLKVPLKNATITSNYGNRSNPITSKKEVHKGMDFAAKKGTGIAAAAEGKVVLVKNSPSYGKYIKVDHGKGLFTLYAHCNSIIKKEGDMVRKGETIATVGNTGQSTGYHLHFEVILNGKNLNPEWLLKW